MLFSDLGSIATDTAIGAMLVSAFAALTGAAGWLLARLVDWQARRRDARAERRAAIVKFYLDVRILVRNTSKVFSAEMLDENIERIRNGGPNFKAYVESAIDESANMRMNELIHTMDTRTMPLIRSYILYSELLQKQYARTGTDDFAALPVERKVNAMRAMFETAATVRNYGSLLVEELKKQPLIAEIDSEITRILDSADGATVTAAGGTGRA